MLHLSLFLFSPSLSLPLSLPSPLSLSRHLILTSIIRALFLIVVLWPTLWLPSGEILPADLPRCNVEALTAVDPVTQSHVVSQNCDILSACTGMCMCVHVWCDIQWVGGHNIIVMNYDVHNIYFTTKQADMIVKYSKYVHECVINETGDQLG